MSIFLRSNLVLFTVCLVCLYPGFHFSQKSFNPVVMASTNLTPNIKTEEVLYTSNGKPARGYIAYDENLKGKLPVVIIVHE